MSKKTVDYSPFYPTTLGIKSHDIRLRQLPAYSIRPKPEIKEKCCKKQRSPCIYQQAIDFHSFVAIISTDSPGPGAYPRDDRKKGMEIPKSLYAADNAFKYSIGVKGYCLRLASLINILIV